MRARSGYLLAILAGLLAGALSAPAGRAADSGCARAGQAIGMQDDCDEFGALLDAYLPKALAGDARAAFQVAMIYMDGDRFTAKSVQWLRRSAEGGDRNGQYYLGRAYQDGGEGLGRDPVRALYWFDRAADQGSRIALSAVRSLAPGMSESEIEAAHALEAGEP